MPGIFEDMNWPDGKVNPSGIATELFYIPKSDIETFPEVSAVPATAGENVSLSGDFVLKTGKTFYRLHSTQGKGKVKFEKTCEKECAMVLNKGTFKFPDVDDAAKNLAKGTINSSVVFVAKLPHQSEKRYVVLGHIDYDSEVKVNGDSGDAPGSDKGITVEVEVPDFTPLPNYTGLLELSGGSLDCSTGVFTPTV
jgi:hypothetical protein